ncbi:MAG: adenylate/guanylate cyclase domain-containing protein, partial [Methylobacterium sp.]
MLPQHRWFWALIVVASGGAGLLYNLLFVGGTSLAAGTIYGLAVGVTVLAYSLAVSALLVFVVRMRDLIGGEVFVNFLVGRYHKPVREERIFLFLDVVGSTAFAETHGDLRAQEYLGAIFATLAEPVRRNAGSTDDYIGDLAMITWPMARGLKDARCVACVFDVLDRIEADAAAWT